LKNDYSSNTVIVAAWLLLATEGDNIIITWRDPGLAILYSPSVIDPEDRLTFVLFGENVFTVESVLASVESFKGAKVQTYTYLLNGSIMTIG
jgi:hypothetical protein